MSLQDDSWFGTCLCVGVFISVVFMVFMPWLGLILLILTLVVLGLIYAVKRRPSWLFSRRNNNKTPRLDDSEQSTSVELSPESVKARILNSQDTHHTQPKKEMPKITKPTEELTGTSLEEQIVELEKRVSSLRHQLQEFPSEDQTLPPSENELHREFDTISNEVELSERAIQQLLETLDEKLAKGAITQELYERLRDRYLERLKKLKK